MCSKLVIKKPEPHYLMAFECLSQPAFTCSKSAIKTPELSVKSVQSQQ